MHTPGVATCHMHSVTAVGKLPTTFPLTSPSWYPLYDHLNLNVNEPIIQIKALSISSYMTLNMAVTLTTTTQCLHTQHITFLQLSNTHKTSQRPSKEVYRWAYSRAFIPPPLTSKPLLFRYGSCQKRVVDGGLYITFQRHLAETSMTSLIPTNILSDNTPSTQPSSTQSVHTP